MATEEDFLGRWSRRKAEARRAAEAPPEPTATEVEPTPAADPPERPPPPELPDPETLEADSDFRPFLAEGVPTALRRQALRRLWRVNPIINSLDGLDDYYVTHDFTDAATVVPDLKTVYRVGKEMVAAARRLDEALPEAPPPEAEPRAIATAEQPAEPDAPLQQAIVSDLERI
jgi:hypothetical protein